MSLIEAIRNKIKPRPALSESVRETDISSVSGQERDIIENQCLELIVKPDFSVPDFEQFVQNMINLLGGKETQTNQQQSKWSNQLKNKEADVIIALRLDRTSYIDDDYGTLTTTISAQHRQTDPYGDIKGSVLESVFSTSYTDNILNEPKINFRISCFWGDVPAKLSSYVLPDEDINPRDDMLPEMLGRNTPKVKPKTLQNLCENLFDLYSKTFRS